MNQPTVIMKYFEQLDRFLRIRVFSREQIQEILHGADVADKSAYLKLVIRSSIVQYAEVVAPAVRERFGDDYWQDVDVALYQTCIDVNPRLEIHQVNILITNPTREDLGPEIPVPKKKEGMSEPYEHEPDSLQAKRIRLATLSRMIIGQDTAIDSVTRAIHRADLGLGDPRRPAAVLMFIGPTGVGKTELACCLSRDIFLEPYLVRVDCSEYTMPHEYAKLIGSPPGYTGHEQESLLVTGLQEKSDRVVLFDEIEKADPSLHDLLLQILDAGQFTTGKGKIIETIGSFIILTSNVGTAELAQAETAMGFHASCLAVDQKKREGIVLRAIEQEFKPEFLNRLDQVIVFESLGDREVEIITRQHVKAFGDRLKENQGIKLQTTVAVIRLLAGEAIDPVYGAREVRRVVGRRLVDFVAEEILHGDWKAGDVCKVSIKRGDLTAERWRK
jgi:ATP-dependent Clp protease ATP-binding subunit ClpC